MKGLQTIKQGSKVVGMMYPKRDGSYQGLSYADVKSRWNIYRRRISGQYKDSENAQSAFELWTWAMQQFEEGRAELKAQQEATQPTQ